MARFVAQLLGWAVLVLLLGLMFVVIQAQRHPALAPYAELTLPPAPEDSPVRVQFAGVTTLVFDDGETAWMTDGFFSRPSWSRMLVPISPDVSVIEQSLRQLGISRLAAVVPVHSHYDHAMDSPVVARLTGATLMGSATTLHIGRGQGLPEGQLREVKVGDTIELGGFTLQFLPARHSPTPFSDGNTVDTLDAPLVPPARASDWPEGQSWALRVTHRSGQRMLVMGSAGFEPGALQDHPVDTVFLGTGTLGKKSEDYRARYWQEVVTTTGAKRVVPVHWDNFWLPLDRPLRAMPRLLDAFDVTMDDLQRRATAGGVELRMPPLWTPFAP